MSAGVNYVGGRGRIAPRQFRNTERLSKEHFAKQRFIDYTQTAQDVSNTPNIKPLPNISLKHALQDFQEHGGDFNKAVTSTSGSQFSSCFSPRVATAPSKPTKQSKLLEMMDSEIRRDESFDASRSRISTMDVKSFVGLDIYSRKRKATCTKVNNSPQKKPHIGFTQASQRLTNAKPRAFILSPTKEPTNTQLTQSSNSEEMLTFDTPSITAEVKASQRSNQASLVEKPNKTGERNTTGFATRHDYSQDQVLPVSPIMSPNLWEKAYSVATQVLGLPCLVTSPESPVLVQDIPPNCGVDHWMALHRHISLSPKDNGSICAFNLVVPAPRDIHRGVSAEPDDTAVTVSTESLQTHPPDLSDSNPFEYNFPVITPPPSSGVPATEDYQGSGRAEPREEHNISQPDQASEYFDRVGRGVSTYPPAVHHLNRELPVIQPTLLHSLRTSNRNSTGTALSLQMPSSRNPPNAKSRVKVQNNGINHPLASDGPEAKALEMLPDSSQDSAECAQPSRISTYSFNLFGDDPDSESDH